MSEFRLDEDSVLRADKLSSHLMHDLSMVLEEGVSSRESGRFFSEERYADLARGTPTKDVVTNVSQMASEFVIWNRWEEKIPCFMLDDGGLAPISLASSLGPPFGTASNIQDWIEFWEHFGLISRRYLLRHFYRHGEKREEGVAFMNNAEAIKGVQRSLKSFLSFRFAGMKKWAEWIQGSAGSFYGGSKGSNKSGGAGSGSPPLPPAVGSGGGLQVQVSCSTPGLRIHVAPAYFINWIFFGSPTTPVTSYVRPGRYMFAGDGPMLPNLTIDEGVFDIPYTFNVCLTRF